MDANFFLFCEGNEEFAFFQYPESRIPSLVENLHDVIERYTGEECKKFILCLEENGKAHTKFIYDEK